MFAKLESLEDTYLDIEQELSSEEVYSDQSRYRHLSKRHAELGEIVAAFREFKRVSADRQANQELLSDADPELRELAHAECKTLDEQLESLQQKLQLLLLPTDPLDERNVILEIRAGTGGDEAGLFAADLFRMYMRYAERTGLRSELIQASES